jgi:flagellar biosynthesis GTPase FlhF
MDIIVFILAGLIAGLGLGYVVFVTARKNQLDSEKARILEEAKSQGENLKKDRILEAKEKYMQLRSEYEKEVNKRNQELSNSENRIRQKEQSLDDKLKNFKQKEDEIAQKQQRLDAQVESYKNKEKELNSLRDQQLSKLGHIPGPLVFLKDEKDPRLGNEFYTFGPRFSHGYGDARHMPTVLVENHSYKNEKWLIYSIDLIFILSFIYLYIFFKL